MLHDFKITDKLTVSIDVKGALADRVFDDNNRNWSSLPAHNHVYLGAQNQYFNDLIRIRPVLLNDVYDALGFNRTPYGAVLGWKKSVDLRLSTLDDGAIRIEFLSLDVVIGEYV